jgi:hypothetical protein
MVDKNNLSNNTVGVGLYSASVTGNSVANSIGSTIAIQAISKEEHPMTEHKSYRETDPAPVPSRRDVYREEELPYA